MQASGVWNSCGTARNILTQFYSFAENYLPQFIKKSYNNETKDLKNGFYH
jgi:hypothetical protein